MPQETAWAQPTPVMDVDIAFPARALEIMPSREECEAALQRLSAQARRKWLDFQDRWFAQGLPKTLQVWLKDGIDGDDAFRHLRVIQGSFAPKHEHKVAAVAYLASLWFEDIDYGDEEDQKT